MLMHYARTRSRTHLHRIMTSGGWGLWCSLARPVFPSGLLYRLTIFPIAAAKTAFPDRGSGSSVELRVRENSAVVEVFNDYSARNSLLYYLMRCLFFIGACLNSVTRRASSMGPLTLGALDNLLADPIPLYHTSLPPPPPPRS